MFIFKPLEFLKLIFPKNFWKKKILTNNFEVKKTAVQAIQKASGLAKRELNPTLNKVVDNYTERNYTLCDVGNSMFFPIKYELEV